MTSSGLSLQKFPPRRLLMSPAVKDQRQRAVGGPKNVVYNSLARKLKLQVVYGAFIHYLNKIG